MKRKLTPSIIVICALIFTLLGCSPKAVEEHINDPITVSGNLDYYAEMDNDAIKEKCVEKHIEVTGKVSKKVSSTMIYLGTEQDDRYYFSCTFPKSIEGYDTLEIGDTVTLHGVCTSFYESTKLINIYGCQIVSTEKIPIETTEPPTTTPTTESTTAPTTETTTEPTTEATNEPTTEPPHTHSFSAATCTVPKTCTCGATEGSANGHDWKGATCKAPKTCKTCGTTMGDVANHSWKAATCKAPKTCKSCGATEGTTKEHSWKEATYSSPKECSNCGKTEGSALEKPSKENYHGHVYTGGSSSTKFHYEEKCPGKNSHEITWEDVDKLCLKPCGTCVLK